MELGQKCCLAIILWLGIVWKCSLVISAPSHCKLSFPNHTFPGNVVPQNLRFMLFYRSATNFVSDSGMLSSRILCLEGLNSSVIALPCDPKKETQKWYQYEGFLLSVKYGKNLAAELQISDPSLIMAPLGSQQWSCIPKKNSNNVFELVMTKNNSRLKLALDENTNRPTFVTSSMSYWGLATGDGIISQSSNASCEHRDGFCKSPIPGVQSYIVNSNTDHHQYVHLPTELVQKALQDEPQRLARTCYSAGSLILIGCPIGHVGVLTPHLPYKAITCLGMNLWSDTVPLHCRKVTCGFPRKFRHATFVSLKDTELVYGEMVHYTCDKDYIGRDVIDICGPDGTWIGDVPDCKHFCDLELTAEAGVIKSPNYPKPYPPILICKWKIVGPKGMRIALWFRDFFIEPGSILPVACRFDVLSINDTAAQKATLPQFCGSTFPSRWLSTGNEVIVEFSSDSSYQAKGFKIEYMMWNYNSIIDLLTYPGISTEPNFATRNGSFADELDKSNIFIRTEYASYVIEGLYGILVITIIFFVIIIVLAHVAKGIKHKVRPLEETEEALRRKNRDHRRNAVAECRDTNVIDTLNKFSGLAVISDVNVFGRIPSMEALVEDINTFQELSGQNQNIGRKKSEMSIESLDIMPPMMFFDRGFYDEEESNLPSTSKHDKSVNFRKSEGRSTWENDDYFFGYQEDSLGDLPSLPEQTNTKAFSLRNVFRFLKKNKN